MQHSDITGKVQLYLSDCPWLFIFSLCTVLQEQITNVSPIPKVQILKVKINPVTFGGQCWPRLGKHQQWKRLKIIEKILLNVFRENEMLRSSLSCCVHLFPITVSLICCSNRWNYVPSIWYLLLIYIKLLETFHKWIKNILSKNLLYSFKHV